MSELKQSFPLQWPVGYKRTNRRESSRFRQTFGQAQQVLKEEVRRLGGMHLIVSTNLQVRIDGNIYATDLNKKINDPGVAIYFKYKGKEVVMCCDKYNTVWENMYALACGIEALRGMERWGVSEFLDRAFTGFTALPPRPEDAPAKNWWTVMFYSDCPGQAPWDWAGVEGQYKSLAKRYHPDVKGGSKELFQELNTAFQEAKKYYGK